jgi:acylphosphatase
MKTIHLKITGKVQGVFFRASAQKYANSLRLTGWVKNTDNYVEAIVSGEESNVDSFVTWAHKGPERAVVERVEVKPEPYTEFKNFDVVRG